MNTLVIAEAGVNHNGDVGRALELIDAAADAGADVVKFQTFRATEIATAAAPKADYQKKATGADETQAGMLARLELDEAAHVRLIERCAARGIEFLSTAFDLDSLDLLLKVGLRRFKVPSGEIHNVPLLTRIAAQGKPIIVSTGMCTLEDVEAALGILASAMLGNESPRRSEIEAAWRSQEGRKLIAERVTVLHCTSAYPAPYDTINLAVLPVLRDKFGVAVGYSDHSLGIAVSIGAVALGAQVIEKHLTLDRTLPGPDHAASLEPDEFASMVAGIRAIEVALGQPVKAPTPLELATAAVARKSLVARTALIKGAAFTVENLGVKRPGTGVSPLRYWDYIGTAATRNYAADEQVDP